MDREAFKDRNDLWLPGLVALLGLMVSLVIWGLLVGDRRNLLLEATRETAGETREAIELHLAQHIETLRALTDFWRRLGSRSSSEARIEQRTGWVEGLISVAWVDLAEPGGGVDAGRDRSEEEIEIDREQARLHDDHPYVAGPERDASGAVSYRVFLPVRTPEDHAGVLIARFAVAPFLESVLQARARGYALSVLWGEEQIFLRGTPSMDRWQRWWRVEETIAFPIGRAHWRVVYRPTPEFAAARLTPIPLYLLGAGILLSVVLAVVVHQLRVIVRQSRVLATSNRALEERGQELESTVAERTEALQDAVKELEAFNYSVSHDLRSPLGAILNLTAILEEDYRERPLDREGMIILSRINRSASRATALLEDLLQLSRAGRAALSFERVDMTALAHEAIGQVRASEEEADVEFIVDPLPEVTGDRTLLGVVFANLFSNAVKYSRGREKRRVTVSGRIEDGECVYEVADNGHGFDMRFIDKVFGLFERLHAAEDVEGTGVGLAMVTRIVKRHGGRVWAKGQPGEGACFFFAIPGVEST